ncbi:hypothetical protein GCM10025858_04970 [Alicyclobacillus sacchari]|nr:hypothetical protein GCM10025858_04970 [Alicyclobacillus sacchari]
MAKTVMRNAAEKDKITTRIASTPIFKRIQYAEQACGTVRSLACVFPSASGNTETRYVYG